MSEPLTRPGFEYLRDLPPFPHAEPMGAWNTMLHVDGDSWVCYAVHPAHAALECRSDALEWAVVPFNPPGFDANGSPVE